MLSFTSSKRYFDKTHLRILLLIASLCVFSLWMFALQKNGDADNYVTAIVERGEIQHLVTATGVLQPRDYVDVGAQVSGQLKKILVVVGQQVNAGDLLAEIDATVYRAKVDGIRAQLLNQQAQLGDKHAQLLLASIRVERQQNLFKEEATTKELLQTAEAGAQSAAALLKALQAQIQQTESSLRAEEANLAYAKIYAPMSGTIVSITSRQGQTLNANQQAPTIMRIADLSSMTVQTQVSEADIGKLHLGMPVYFTTLGGQDYRWYSKLDRVEPTPQITNNVVLYNALFDVPNESRTLMTSMSTQVFFIVAQARDTLIIPASAVNFKLQKQSDDEAPPSGDDKKNWSDKKPKVETDKKNDEVKSQAAIVQVMDEKGHVIERKITQGVSNRVRVQVLTGLQEGEKVVAGIRQPEKTTSLNAVPVVPGAAGTASGSGARQMR